MSFQAEPCLVCLNDVCITAYLVVCLTYYVLVSVGLVNFASRSGVRV